MLKVLDHLEEWLIAFLMAAATSIIFVAVIHRYAASVSFLYDYVHHIDLAWAQELCIIMFVWMAKFGAAYGVRTGIHVGVDVLINRLSPRTRGRFIVFGLLAGAAFTGTVASLGAEFVWENGAHFAIFNVLGIAGDDLFEGPTTPDLEWPTWAVYSAIPLGSALMCFRFLQVCVQFLRTGELPHHDHAHVEGIEEESGLPQPKHEQGNWFDMDDNLHPKDLTPREGNEGGDASVGEGGNSVAGANKGQWEGGDASAKQEDR